MTKRNFDCLETYEAPAIDVMGVLCEGVLCQSGLNINDWVEDDELLDFE